MAVLASGQTYEDLTKEEQDQYNIDLPGAWRDVVRLQPGGWIMTRRYLKFQEKVYNFQFRPDDILVMTYPKCGTTWTQEILWTMRSNPDLTNPNSGDALFVRSPYIESDMLMDEEHIKKPEMLEMMMKVFFKGHEKYVSDINMDLGYAFQIADAHAGGRILKTHLPFSFYPNDLLTKCKVVYVARNVKDNLISAMHHYKNLPQHGFNGSLDTFISYYTKGLLTYGSYAEHLAETCDKKDHPNFHLLQYEDLKDDFMKEAKRLEAFIGTSLTTEQFANVHKQTTLKSMRAMVKGAAVDPAEKTDENAQFFRKGIAGGWKGEFNDDQLKVLDTYIEENITPLGFNFKYQ